MALSCGPYQLVERLQIDALAEYFLARLPEGEPGADVVVKRLLPSFSGEERGFFEAMFRDEVRVSSILEHPNVLRVLDFGDDDGTPFLVIERFDAIDLGSLLRECHERRIAIPVDVSGRVIAEVLRALDYVHKREDPRTGKLLEIVHRDICPATIHLGGDGRVRISNFSIARSRSNRSVTDPGVLKGRYSYMSPEQARGDTLDHRSDLFACGIVLYELVTGVRPFRGKTDLEILNRVKAAAHDAPKNVNSALPDALAAAIERSLEADPARRYADAGDFLETLMETGLVGSLGSVAAFVARAARERSRRPDRERDTEPRERAGGATALGPPQTPSAIEPSRDHEETPHADMPVFDLAAPEAVRTSIAGGKGASLGKLSQAGFRVPEAVIVGAAAYRAFIAGDAELARRVAALDPTDAARLAVDCSAIRKGLLSRPLPPALDSLLRASVAPLAEAGPVAVRSSSTLEDLEGAAFAGQHDTFLGVKGVDSIVEKVRACFASLWEDRAVRYRHERGFAGERASMAVVVQRMIPAEIAGVAFGIDPVRGDPDRVSISSAFGLGETVVAGDGGADVFLLDKKTGALLESTLSDKEEMLVMAAGGGTRRERVAEAKRQAPSLDARALADIRALVSGAERFYSFPQDIEWAIAEGKLWLLQSRPVTRVPPRWTRDESAERFPNVTTPLVWEFVADGFHDSLAASLSMMGLPPVRERWFERFDGYVYGNQNAVRLYASLAQVPFESVEDLAARAPALRERYRFVQHLPVTWARDLDWYLVSLGRLAARDLAPLSEAALLEHVHAIDALGREYFRPNIAISLTQALLHRTLFALVTMVAGPAEAPGLYDSLTCFCDTKTNLVNRDLQALAAIVRVDPRLASELESTERRRFFESGRLAAFPILAAALERFLRDHGHREVDWDVYVPTWSGQPWVVLENVRLLAQREALNPDDREEALRLRQTDAESRFVRAVESRAGSSAETARFIASELLRLARAYTALDDLEHYQTTRLSIPFRAALVALGNRLAARGALESGDDVFFLHRSTLEALVAGAFDPAKARAEAIAGRADHARWKRSAPVWDRSAASPAEPADATTLRGIPGAPGIAEGIVARVFSVEDFAKFPRGSVLVARTTNPAWTPLFYSAAAVITESGGPLSHGAVTAREIGLPAVMAVKGALSLLEDGVRVRVDGTSGLIRRL